MRNALLALCLTVATIASADPRDWAKRIPCELQTAGVASLPTLELLQGSSPLIACDQYRSGKALTVTNDVQAVMRFSSSLTNTLWVSVTNQSYYSNSYLIQLPSLGTNAVNWVYTILYYKDGSIYWTGTGRLDIKATEVTGNALTWQAVIGAVTTNTVNSLIATHNTNLTAHATLLSSYVTQAMTNGWTVSAHSDWLVRSETNGWVVSSHDGLVPYTGATTTVNIGTNIVIASGLQANSSAGGSLKALNGSSCLTWGAGGGCVVSTSDGLTVNGTATANLFSGNGASLTNLPTSAVVGLDSALAGKVGTSDAGYLGAVAHTNRTDNPHSVTASQVGAVATNDTRYLASVTNNQGVVKFGTSSIETFANGDLIFGNYGKVYGTSYSEMTLGHKSLGNVNDFAFTQNAAGNTVFNGASTIYFRRSNVTQASYSDTMFTFEKSITVKNSATINNSLTVATNLTVTGVSYIILPTSTNGLASGMLWNNSGTISIMP